MNMMTKKIFLLLLLILLFPFVDAYVADVIITIEDDGLVTITGNTNHPSLLELNESYSLTKKLDKYWYFDLNITGFDKLYYSIILPENTEINNFISNNNTRISSKYNSINIIGYDINNSLEISVKYSKYTTSSFSNIFWIIFLSIIIFILILLYFYLFIFNFKKEKKPIKLDLRNLNNRQKQIISILEKENEVSQNKLLLLIKIPKSSLSRNLQSLEKKGYVYRQKSGLTYIIKLKK